jgi:hypothetical protein
LAVTFKKLSSDIDNINTEISFMGLGRNFAGKEKKKER